MIKVLQFGEGNFLRTFVDAYFDTLNKEGAGEYSVDIVSRFRSVRSKNLKDRTINIISFCAALRTEKRSRTFIKSTF